MLRELATVLGASSRNLASIFWTTLYLIVTKAAVRLAAVRLDAVRLAAADIDDEVVSFKLG